MKNKRSNKSRLHPTHNDTSENSFESDKVGAYLSFIHPSQKQTYILHEVKSFVARRDLSITRSFHSWVSTKTMMLSLRCLYICYRKAGRSKATQEKSPGFSQQRPQMFFSQRCQHNHSRFYTEGCLLSMQCTPFTSARIGPFQTKPKVS